VATKIGEALVAKGVLTPPQLATALQAQMMRGGHLGTSLIELGFVNEVTLGRTLGQLLGMRCAPKEMFHDIPEEVIAALPAEEAERRHVVPIGIEGRALHLAVVDSTNLSGLSAVTGYKVVPYVAPEARIVKALETYYGVPRRLRFAGVSVRGAGRTASESSPRRESVPLSPLATARRPPSSPTTLGQGTAIGALAAVEEPPTSMPEVTSERLRALSERMSRVRSHVELGELLLDDALDGCRRRLLFAVEGDGVEVANSKGFAVDPQIWSGLYLPVVPESIFGLTAEDSYYRGPVPADFDGSSFFGKLSIETPREIALLPIYGECSLEAVLYGDGGVDGTLEPTDLSYPRMQQMIGLAVRMLTLRAKLCRP